MRPSRQPHEQSSDLGELAALAQLYNVMAGPQLAQQAQASTDSDRSFQSVLALLGLHQHTADADAQRALTQAGIDQTGRFHSEDLASHGEDRAARQAEFATSNQLGQETLDFQRQNAVGEVADRALAREEAAKSHTGDLAAHKQAAMGDFVTRLAGSNLIDHELIAPMMKQVFPEFAGPLDTFQGQQDDAAAQVLGPAYQKIGPAALGNASPGVRSRLQSATPPTPTGAPGLSPADYSERGDFGAIAANLGRPDPAIAAKKLELNKEQTFMRQLQQDPAAWRAYQAKKMGLPAEAF